MIDALHYEKKRAPLAFGFIPQHNGPATDGKGRAGPLLALSQKPCTPVFGFAVITTNFWNGSVSKTAPIRAAAVLAMRIMAGCS